MWSVQARPDMWAWSSLPWTRASLACNCIGSHAALCRRWTGTATSCSMDGWHPAHLLSHLRLPRHLRHLRYFRQDTHACWIPGPLVGRLLALREHRLGS
eukprot:10381634-Lingulodinium_polyedra.AAC.1